MARVTFLFFFSHEPWLLPPSLEMIYALGKRGHTVDVLYCDRQTVRGTLEGFLIQESFECGDGGRGFLDRCFLPFRLRRQLGKILKRKNYNAVVACDIAALQVLAETPRLNFRKIYWAFELTGVQRSLRVSWDAYRSIFFSSFLGKMDLVIVPSKQRREIIKHYCRHSPIIVIGNFRADRFDNVSAGGERHDDQIKMVFAGRISFASGVGKIMKEVAKHPKLSLTLVGIMDPLFEDWFRSAAFKNVRYGGILENAILIDFLRQFDVSVCTYAQRSPMSIEALYPAPTKAGDAIAAGCILLCTAQPYLEELTENTSLGFSFEESERASVVARIAALRRSEINAFRERLRSAFREKYCMDVKVDLLLTAL